MARGTTAMEVRANGVAVITISNAPVNALSLDVLASLQRNYAEALRRNDVKAIVVTGAKGRFCGGFDINAFDNKPKNEKPGSLSIDFLTDIVEDARKPSVAAIDGIALGGGLEVAMGLLVYNDRRKTSPDPDLRKYIEKSSTMAGIAQNDKLSDNDIVEMIFLPVVNEACRVLDEGIAVKSSDLDVASIMGMGFPSYRGGVMFWADSLGAKYVYDRLEAWSKDYGGLFKPCEYLAARARQNTSLAAMVDVQFVGGKPDAPNSDAFLAFVFLLFSASNSRAQGYIMYP